MGTRSLTHLYEEGEKRPFCTIYRQFDGYLSGMGADIKKILGSKKLVNGYSDPANQVNGMNCAAAMLVAGLKEGCGNVYIYKANSRDCGEQYIYRLYANGETFKVKVQSGYKRFKTVYEGDLVDMPTEDDNS